MGSLTRGVVLSPAVITTKAFEIRGDVPLLAALPPALVYWDRILMPRVAIGRMPALEAVFDPLIDMGVAETFDVSAGGFRSGTGPQVVEEIKLGVLERTSRVGETWSYMLELEKGASTSDLVGHEDGNAQQLLSLRIALANALPLPPPNTPFEDIIRYRQARTDELARLHHELDAIAAVYASDPNHGDAAAKALERLGLALDDIEATQKEKWGAVVKRALSYAAVFDAAAPAAALALAGQPFDLSLAFGAGVAAVRGVYEGIKGVDETVKAHPFAYAVGFDAI